MSGWTLKVRVARIRQEACDIASFDLASLDGRELPSFEPGSHIDVHLPGGLMRQYSLCNGPDERTFYRIAVKREPQSRGGSRALHESVRPGDAVTVSTPRNNFAVDPSASTHLLLAGGIGVTPLLSMAKHFVSHGAAFELQYFTRSPEHTAFRALLSAPPYSDYVAFLYGYDPERLEGHLRRAVGQRREGRHLYVCGPPPFMELVTTVASDAWPREAIHLEYFTAPAAVQTGADQTFEVHLARTGSTCTIPPGRTIAEVLIEHGIDVPTSCEMGVCGTCITRVIEGKPDHRDFYLTDSEKEAGSMIALCVSRSRSPRLVLDI